MITPIRFETSLVARNKRIEIRVAENFDQAAGGPAPDDHVRATLRRHIAIERLPMDMEPRAKFLGRFPILVCGSHAISALLQVFDRPRFQRRLVRSRDLE
ncbi:MAG TPA: hypothetical protein VNP98_17200 [Chthoniobacterales bacterium]|nr:hypothetical protein [Chthoniobacterales bacterium]